MARIVSPVWSEARGSIAGTTYLTTPTGQIIARQRTRPVDQPTNPRTHIRNTMITLASAWRELTDQQRGDWDVWAGGHGYSNGRQAFMAGPAVIEYVIRSMLLTPQISRVNTAPNGTKTPSVAVQTLTPVGPGTGLVNIGMDNEGAMDCVCLIEISPPQDPSRNYYKGPWDSSRTTAIVAADASQGSYEFEGLQTDAKYFIRVRAVSHASGVQQTGAIVQPAMIVRAIAEDV